MRQIFIASVLPAPDSPEIRMDCEFESRTIVLNLWANAPSGVNPDGSRERCEGAGAQTVWAAAACGARHIDEGVNVRRKVRPLPALVLGADRLADAARILERVDRHDNVADIGVDHLRLWASGRQVRARQTEADKEAFWRGRGAGWGQTSCTLKRRFRLSRMESFVSVGSEIMSL